MIVEMHTPQGIIPIDTEDYTVDELVALGISPELFYTSYIRPEELRIIFLKAHGSATIPPPGLTALILNICEYLKPSQNV